MTRTPPRRSEERGYVLMIVMILLVVLTAAGVYGLRVIESDVRSSAMVRRSEMAVNAAEAGIGLRLAEIIRATDDAGAALDSRVERTGPLDTDPLRWHDYQPTSSLSNDVGQGVRFVVSSVPVVAVEANPPPGIQVGTGGQATLWRIDGYAVGKSAQAAVGAVVSSVSQRISVGVSLWSRGGLSYNTN